MQVILWRMSLSPYFSSATLFFCLAFSFLARTTNALVKLPPNITVPAILVFGDSIMDTGNNNNLKTLVKCNYLPYGENFKGGIPTGRFSDGKVPSDIIAEELGLKDTVPAYLDPGLLPQDLTTGVTFASGGAGYDSLTSNLLLVIPLSDQLENFKEYTTKLTGLVGEEKAKFILANAIFIVVAVSDDIANNYFLAPVRKLEYNVSEYVAFLANNSSNFVQDLHKLGARRIGVFSAPPIGCVPLQRTLAGGSGRDCVEEYNEAALLFNSKLSPMLDSLSNNLPDSKIVFIDVYTPLLDLIQNPNNYGFRVADKGCCGTGDLEVAMLCNRLNPFTCSNASEYVFWDSFHPTESAYRALVSLLLNKYIDKFF